MGEEKIVFLIDMLNIGGQHTYDVETIHKQKILNLKSGQNLKLVKNMYNHSKSCVKEIYL